MLETFQDLGQYPIWNGGAPWGGGGVPDAAQGCVQNRRDAVGFNSQIVAEIGLLLAISSSKKRAIQS